MCYQVTLFDAKLKDTGEEVESIMAIMKFLRLDPQTPTVRGQ